MKRIANTLPTLLSINNYHYRRDHTDAVYLDHNSIFARCDWKVVPFSMRHPLNLESEWSNYFIDEIEFGNEYSLLQRLRRAPKVVYSLESQRKIGNLVDVVRPDIAHCHTIYHHLSPAILPVLAKRGVPTFMTLHDLKLACPAYHMYTAQRGTCEACLGGRLRNVVFGRCIKDSILLSGLIYLEATLHRILDTYAQYINRFISPCRFYVDKLVEWGWPRDLFEVIPNPLVLDEWRPEYEAGSYALYFGRLSPEKGLVGLVRAAALSGVPVHVVGEGPERDALMSEVKRLSAPVTFHLPRNIGDLREIIARARVTVVPSLWYENSPMNLLESYAMGKPVIGSAIGGIPELIEHGVTGVTFPPGSEEELAECLASFQALPDTRILEMGQTCREYVMQHHSPDEYVQKTLAAYRKSGWRV